MVMEPRFNISDARLQLGSTAQPGVLPAQSEQLFRCLRGDEPPSKTGKMASTISLFPDSGCLVDMGACTGWGHGGYRTWNIGLSPSRLSSNLCRLDGQVVVDDTLGSTAVVISSKWWPFLPLVHCCSLVQTPASISSDSPTSTALECVTSWKLRLQGVLKVPVLPPSLEESVLTNLLVSD